MVTQSCCRTAAAAIMPSGISKCQCWLRSIEWSRGINGGLAAQATSKSKPDRYPLSTIARLLDHRDLAQLASSPTAFNRDGWTFELKHDGFRMLAANRKRRAGLVSRRGNDFADRFPEIASALLQLPPIVIDCELVS